MYSVWSVNEQNLFHPAEPEPEPDPSPERWGEYMKNKYMGQGLRDLRNKLNANIIRAMCLLIAPSMTLQGYFILLFCSVQKVQLR